MRDFTRLRELLLKGFLTAPITLGSVPIVLKSLNQQEHDMVDLQSFDPSKDWTFHAGYVLAYATIFINHVNVLPVRNEVIVELAETYQGLPKPILSKLLAILNHMGKQSRSALQLVQPFCYGPESRQLWYMLRDQPLCSETVTGIQGTGVLGLNIHQKLWSYFNLIEDEEVTYLREYGLAKFMVSPHAPKDVQKMDSKDRQKIENRDKRRQALYQGKEILGENNEIRISDESAEDLLRQMERDVRGEKDFHDMVIENHKRAVREGYLRRQAEILEHRKQRYIQEIQEERDEIQEALGFEGYTEEEISHYLQMSDQKRKERVINELERDMTNLEDQETNLLRWGFISKEDIKRRDAIEKSLIDPYSDET
jgi:hypothetical protein